MDSVSIIAFSLAAAFAVAFFVVLFIFLKRRTLNNSDIDAMTGLLSRESFLKESAVALKKNTDDGRKSAMIVFDVDGHGKISTLFGAEVGNSVVKGFSDAVKQATKGRFRASRVDNDDFAVLISYTRDAEIDAFVSDFREALGSIFSGTSVMDQVDFFAGIAVYDGIDDVYTLFNKANLCLIMNDGNRVTRFSEEMEKRMVEDEILRAEMVGALEEGQFELYYQPKISFSTGVITGVEALIRWHHPSKGFVSPNEFIPLAEQTGLITQIDEWGLRTACRQCKQWQDDGLPPVKISVNMSQAQFYRTDVISTVTNVLEETGLDPQWLEIEVTETMAMRDIERTKNILSRIRSMGVSISMDDFGSGYSSLSSLKTIPLDILKIDRSLVCDLDENDVSKQITGAIVNLGKAMKLVILAEGVETEEQCEFLTNIGCDLAQGYYYSKPRSAAEITALLLMPKEALLKQV